ncbi:MAG: DNA repair protein RadC [Chloroflexi bacterium]|nr:DNA repair protein RadC [Chloroflexota bacterium]
MIRDLPVGERPRERLRDHGAGSLSNAELMAIILRTGTSRESVLNVAARVLARFSGLAGIARASFGELCAEKGLGEAKSAQLKAALELGKRLVSFQPEERAVIHSPQDVANLLLADMSFLEQEHLRVVLLNTRNQVIAIPEVYKGSVNTSLIRVGEVFREAVRENCPAIIVVHNHPSGDPTPSKEDVGVTEQLLEAGRLLDIEVLDHLVIGQQKYVSLKEKGLGFSK